LFDKGEKLGKGTKIQAYFRIPPKDQLSGKVMHAEDVRNFVWGSARENPQ